MRNQLRRTRWIVESRVLALALSLAFSAAAASRAEIMEGQHLILVGSGIMLPNSFYKRTSVNNPRPGGNAGLTQLAGYSVDTSQALPGDNYLGTLQYAYSLTPRWSAGLLLGVTQMHKETTTNQLIGTNNFFFGPALPVYATHVKTDATALEVIPTARYTMLPEHRVNPYFTGGVGFYRVVANELTSYAGGWVSGTESRSYTGTAVAVLAGAGVQAALSNHWMAGAEFRLESLLFFSSTFGTSAPGAFDVWLGYKWSAPL